MTVQVFKDAGLEKVRLESEAAEMRSAADTARITAEQERAVSAKQQDFVVHSVAAGLEKLSAGDVMFRLNTAFESKFEKLRGDYNAAMETLQETMQAIATNARAFAPVQRRSPRRPTICPVGQSSRRQP